MIPSTIRFGTRNTAVAQWQRILGNVVADGIFGAKTEAATKAWQAAHGLTPDGIVGPMTWSVSGWPTEVTSERVPGIDISRVQGVVDFAAVRAAGFRWGVAKATEGAGYVDPMFRQYVRAGADQGVLMGAYAFARPDAAALDAARECEFLFRTCEGLPLDMRPTLDLESMGKLSGAACYQWAGEWVARAIQLWGTEPIIYTGAAFWQGLGVAAARSEWAARCPIWFAQYPVDPAKSPAAARAYEPGANASPRLAAPWTTWDAWQYSGNGGKRVPGVKVDCDRNVFRGSLDDFRARMVIGGDDAA